MRRRRFLATATTGVAVGLGGCLGGEVVLEVQELVRVAAGTGWIQEISDASGSAEVGYNVQSEDDRFEVFYFTDPSEFEPYEEYVMSMGDSKEDVRDLEERPTGDRKLSSIARENEDGSIFQAKVPEDGSRMSVDFDGSHYFAVDYSNYGTLPVTERTNEIQTTIDLEVVEGRF